MGFIAVPLNLIKKAFSSLRFLFNLRIDFLDASNSYVTTPDSYNGDNSKEYGNTCQPPVDGIRSVIQKFASEFVEMALDFDFRPP